MTLSIWRYAHLVLALVASFFVLIATLTGMILAFEPISNQLKPLKSSNFEDVELFETVLQLKEKYTEVLSLEVDENRFVKTEVVDEQGDTMIFYIDPKTAATVGETYKRPELFSFTTTLHRSLFMGKVGRIVMAVTAFLLFLIAVSGMILIVRKQKSWKRFFNKLVKERFFPHYHTFLGRLLLFPITVITLTGIYLSLEGFSLITSPKIDFEDIDYEQINEKPHRSIADFEVFHIPLSDVKKLTFPIFEDVEETYRLELIDSEFIINQFTGEVLAQSPKSTVKAMTYYSMILHTGRGTVLWAVILFLSCISILFFIYSGFVITLKRRKSKIRNPYTKDNCQYVILVGSEGGTTLGFANLVHHELIRQGKKSYLAEMNSLSEYPKMEHLIVMTCTYGKGNEPVNATKFKSLWQKNTIQKPFTYSVVGFGSLAYPDYCKYAYEVDELLAKTSIGKKIVDLQTVNNQSVESFSLWANEWARQQGFSLNLPFNKLAKKKGKQHTFKVIEKTTIQSDETFLVRLQTIENVRFTSGDLLGITSEVDGRERLYSIGKTASNEILLSVKRHEKGLISNMLNNLKSGDLLKSAIYKNPEFHFPKKGKPVVCIATGTGIAPFLGMIADNEAHQPLTLFWGGKNDRSLVIYKSFLEEQLRVGKLTNLQIAYSRMGAKKYVQDIVLEQSTFFANLLKSGGVVMICGSVAMQRGVAEILESICQEQLQKPLSYFQNRQQYKVDCY
ncbi:PepSY domain-containing protein [Capnocytophaga canis]|uniref:NADPH--hemoprotein reductase n=1 Tax=Capnocytophaga canis TaxID=1848903 RepID=A0A0B7IAF5_9FLAO|nr:PepSY domain-containing protein [Capnocytophaga canis]CEN48680.1 putative nitric-oxide synthase [Capnocytophaga canis]